MGTKDKRIIWSSEINLDDWRDDLKEEHPNASEGELWDIACDINAEYLNDERMNLGGVVADEGIVILASLGLWYGRRQAYREVESGKVSDCLRMYHKEIEWYCDRYDFCGSECHHDGTNYYTYRAWKPGLSETQKMNFLIKWIKGDTTGRDISRYTKSLRPEIAKVYGW